MTMNLGLKMGGGVTQHEQIYTFGSTDGATEDLGEEHEYRYVNATNVYNKGKTKGVVKYWHIGHGRDGDNTRRDYYSAVIDTGSTTNKDMLVVLYTDGNDAPVSMYLQGSTNNSSWTNIFNATGSNGSFKTVAFKTGAYRYFRALVNTQRGRGYVYAEIVDLTPRVQ